MRAIRIIILVAEMAALLAGCRSGCDQDGISRPEDSYLGRVIDSPALTGTPSQRGRTRSGSIMSGWSGGGCCMEG